MIVNFRPKYLKRRQQNQDAKKDVQEQQEQQQEEERAQNSMNGKQDAAAAAAVDAPEGGEQQSPAASHFYVAAAMGSQIQDHVSPLTASTGVYDHVSAAQKADNRWGAVTDTTRNSSRAVSSKSSSASWIPTKSSANERISDLDASSVEEESTSNGRWLSDSHRSSSKKLKAKAASTKSLAMPQRVSSDFEITDDTEIEVPEPETRKEKKRSKSLAMFLSMPLRKSLITNPRKTDR